MCNSTVKFGANPFGDTKEELLKNAERRLATNDEDNGSGFKVYQYIIERGNGCVLEYEENPDEMNPEDAEMYFGLKALEQMGYIKRKEANVIEFRPCGR